MEMTTRMELLPIDTLLLSPENARTHGAAQIELLRESLREFGFVAPVLIDRDRNVIAGYGRLAAASAEGIPEVPCVWVDHLTETQRDAYMLADNRLAEMAGWDRDLVSAQLIRLRDAGFDLHLTGFSDSDIRLDLPQEPFEDDFDPAIAEGQALPEGSLWQLGNHRLLVGDATAAADTARLMHGTAADLLLTDPPYGVDYVSEAGQRIENDDLQGERFLRFLTDAFFNARAHMRPGAAFYIWHPDGEPGLEFRQALRTVGLPVRQCLVWVKQSAVLSPPGLPLAA